ncbi:MAG TPA: AraC family transcriptional regulator [Candidatus Blautia faecigallinarum]|uniref:Stage 0 sporulation protein A homolog n=1 Tax=Candidatus Blautia faecigallinarum TaxID=2838488 RepID=A0A9D2DQB9_9FIRM|nr:AraC family transcriptional regulator [Candidatus Blautia faecigallinarum]
MYRILLADDEGIMLESLKSIIRSNYGSECEIACAKTGRAVVEQVESFRPDIAFVDIQMPGLNGIQAIKEVRKFNNSVIFVIITAYDKFTYAREAINLGVMEYLTKPINKKKFLQVCTEAMQKVDESRQKRSDDLKIREKLEIVIPILESGYIYNLLLQDDFHTYEDNYKELLNIQENYAFMAVAEFGDSVENGILTNAVGASVRASKFYPEFREIAKGFFQCMVGPVMGNRIVLLVPHEKEKTEYEERVEILTRMRNMIHKLENRIDCKFRAGIGRVCTLENARESYTEALRALRESSNHVVHINDIPLNQEYDGEYPLDLENRYCQRAMEADYTGASQAADQFFDWMLKNYENYREDIEIKVLELVMRIEYKAFFKGGVKYGFRYRENYLKEIRGCRDYGELRAWFLERTEDVCRGMATNKAKEAESVVEKAKAYMKENYQKDISLDDVSRMVDISPYYFSKLFKQEQGEGFLEYLTGVRMSAAREFLRNQNYSIKEVCSMCGYSDPNYFSRIFKRYEGVTPSEYRERLG